ncbi:fused MFS/spermidine synthase [Verrucomicrobiota bacterium]
MARKRWILAGYFLSGASSLIAEVIWVRLLKLTLGNTVYASSIVVSVFLGGLALGAVLIGRRADRSSSPLRLYVGLELTVAVLILVSPFAISGADSLYRVFYQGLNPSAGTLLFAQVLVSGLLILIPTTVMGATFPVLGVVVARMASDRNAGRPVGNLYAVNTLGAALGCFLAGFVLIRAIGVMATLGVSVALQFLAHRPSHRLLPRRLRLGGLRDLLDARVGDIRPGADLCVFRRAHRLPAGTRDRGLAGESARLRAYFARSTGDRARSAGCIGVRLRAVAGNESGSPCEPVVSVGREDGNQRRVAV